MDCCASSLRLQHGAGAKITYVPGRGFSFTDMTPLLRIWQGAGGAGSPLLTVGLTETPKGSRFVIADGSLLLEITAGDAGDIPVADDVFFDITLADVSGFVSPFVGGAVDVDADGSQGPSAASGSVTVALNGLQVPVVIQGGSLGPAMATAISDLNLAVSEAEAAAAAAKQAKDAAEAALANKLDVDGANIGANAPQVRSALQVPTAAEAAGYLEDNGASITADMALSATFPVSPASMAFYGDSITYGYVQSTVDDDDCWRGLVAARRGKTSLNYGIPGGSIMDTTNLMTGTSVLARHPVLAGDEAAGLFGFNDQRYNGVEAADVRAFGRAVLAAAVWRAIPDDLKVFANNAAVTYSGTWGGSPVKNGDWYFTGADGAYAEATLTGTAIYLMVLRQPLDGATVEVHVDGELKVTEDLSTTIGNGGAVKWSAGVINPAGSPLGWQVDCIRVDGLARGPHVVRITKTGGNFLHFGCFASNGSAATASARFYLGNVLRISPTGAGLDTPYDNYTDEGNRLHNAEIEEVARVLQGDGLDVRLVDANAAWNPITDPSSDNIHPTAAGHASIATAFLRAMDITRPRLLPAEPTTSTNATSYTPVLAGSATAGTHTYATQDGSYTLISGMCFARGLITLSAFDTGQAGYAYDTLPVTAAALTPAALGRIENVTLDTGFFGFYLETIQGTNRAILRQKKSADAYGEVAPGNFADDTSISFSVAFPYQE